jgi:hypothetical protein
VLDKSTYVDTFGIVDMKVVVMLNLFGYGVRG